MPGFPGVVTAVADLARVGSVPVVPDEVQRRRDRPRGGQGGPRLRPDLDGRSAIPWSVAASAYLDKTGADRKTAFEPDRGD